MGKDPAFLFYPNDYLGGTMGMTLEEKGGYMELLMMQFNLGKFTEAQAKQVLSICFDVAWPMLKLKFETDGTFYWNKRLATEIQKRKDFSESRRINASGPKTKKESKSKLKASAKHMPKHMENRNENRNISKVERKNKFEKLTIELNKDIGLNEKDIKKFNLFYTASGPNDIKLHFEKQKTWDHKARMRTWKLNSHENYTDNIKSEPKWGQTIDEALNEAFGTK